MTRRMNPTNTLLLVIDVQEKLAGVIDEMESVDANIDRLIRGFHLLGAPALFSEQYPQGLGPTTPTIRKAFDETYGSEPQQKMRFSCCGSTEFLDRLRSLERKHVVVAGIEAHVCVYQTVIDLLDNEYEVSIVADAISSRTARNREIAIQRMTNEGARLSSTEMVLFEMTVESGTERFRAISKLVK